MPKHAHKKKTWISKELSKLVWMTSPYTRSPDLLYNKLLFLCPRRPSCGTRKELPVLQYHSDEFFPCCLQTRLHWYVVWATGVAGIEICKNLKKEEGRVHLLRIWDGNLLL